MGRAEEAFCSLLPSLLEGAVGAFEEITVPVEAVHSADSSGSLGSPLCSTVFLETAMITFSFLRFLSIVRSDELYLMYLVFSYAFK